jgi:hypothetical protein
MSPTYCEQQKVQIVMADTGLRIEDLEWAVNSRHKNQQCALGLYKLLEEYEDKRGWSEDNSFIARSLVGIAFSLWRAAFLGDKKVGTNKESRKKAKAYLGKVIQDNAISFPQDRDHKEWTYDYYIENAYLRLRHLRSVNQWLMACEPNWPYNKKSKMNPKEHWKEHWNDAHDFLLEAVKNFRNRLETHMPKRTSD